MLETSSLPGGLGTYVVWLRVQEPVRLAVGRLGVYELPRGIYAYVGSAHSPGGLRARLGRHLRADKKPHWHIDALTGVVPVVALWFVESPGRLECTWAQRITDSPGVIEPIAGFGASDCGCPTHLFGVPPEQLRAVWDALKRPTVMTHDAAFTFLE